MTITRKLRGIIQLFRPDLALAAGMCVVIGELLALGAFPHLRDLALGFACGFFLSGSALILNDIFDLEVDRINAPERPVPAGLVSPVEVIALAIITAIIGLAAAWALNPVAFVPALAIWVIGFLYNWKLKAMGLWGNLMVAISVAATFVMGGIGVGHVWNKTVWLFALIGFTLDLGEEIAGDVMDIEGDRKRGSRSIAITRGRPFALRISTVLLLLTVLLMFVPIVWGLLGTVYLITTSVAGVSMLFFIVRLNRSRTPGEGRQSMRGIYLSASLGLLAFLIGSFFG